MSRGPKLGVFGRISEAYQTFLVLGPIDLTNGRASMMNPFSFTLRGNKKLIAKEIKKYKNNELNKRLRPFG
jgi:hypothetical protein